MFVFLKKLFQGFFPVTFVGRFRLLIILMLLPIYILVIYSSLEMRRFELRESEENIKHILDIISAPANFSGGLDHFALHSQELFGDALPAGSVLDLLNQDGVILARVPENQKWAGKNISNTELAKTVFEIGTGSAIMMGLDARKRFYVFKTLHGPGLEFPIFLSIGVPQEVIFNYINRLLLRNLFGLIIVSIIALFIAWGMGNILVIQRVKNLEEVDRLKSEFVSLASHQLRTPLTAVLWSLEILKNEQAGELNSEQKRFLEDAIDSTNRLISLVRLFLNIGRIESGRLKISPQLTDLNALLDDIIQEVASDANEKSINLESKMSPSLPVVNIDPLIFRQIILNLLSNGIRYTPRGGFVRLVVARKGNDLRFNVIDSGIGIPEAEQRYVFERFFRASNVEMESASGTGLGLFLVKILVELYGGRIGFVSKEKQGSTFWFTVPLKGMKTRAGEVNLQI